MVTKAINIFSPDKACNENSSILNTFRHLIFRMCKARLIILIKQSTTLKKKTLNRSKSLDCLNQDGEGNEYCNYDKIQFADPREKVDDSLSRRQREDLLKEKINSYLTDLEKNVFALLIEGYSYLEVSETLNIVEKSVDNAIQRVTKKIRTNRGPILISGDVDFKIDQIKKKKKPRKKKGIE